MMLSKENLKVVFEHVLENPIDIQKPDFGLVMLSLYLKLVYNIKEVLYIHDPYNIFSKDKILSSFLKEIS
jgi:hypothetical protein